MKKPPRSKPLLRDTEAPIRSRPRSKRNPAQPQLLFDPMPERVEPALAELKSRPPKGSEWSWELKWDGYRLAVHIEPQGIRILTRGGHDWTHRFPAIEQAARALGPATMIIDGEAVVLDEEGRPDFGLLQQSLGASGKQAGNRASNAVLYAFDLVYLDGHNLRGVEYRSRRHLLEDTLNNQKDDKVGAVRLSETLDGEPAVLLQHICRLGLEGIVGYERSAASPAGFGSLVLAAYRGADLVHVGSVGTGFREAEIIRLRKMLDTLRWKRKQPPLPYSGSADIVWVEPTLIAEIEFRAWSSDGKLRRPSYKGLRERQDNADVFRLD
ncbi:ATP-dependent DNA ligase (plasmid) [Rhizobium leguminosarum]|uniref:ATP-dependent DNA ligase n=1 Tax=Rhizobium leguminosarum TaxID=384 RepID=UPI0010315DB6|nr:ATP-dependent DNA ligase [Rhizobium leguminosarum]TBF23405.1 ATP-dependent DNA ligase [Rhizobium leguminosarum]TBG29499.1 ATP-dependent DNA ligase [Rhizobium leguminosarum]